MKKKEKVQQKENVSFISTKRKDWLWILGEKEGQKENRNNGTKVGTCNLYYIYKNR